MSQESKSFGFSVVIFAVIGAVILFIAWAMSSVTGDAQADMSPQAVAERIQPVGRLNTGETVVAAAAQPEPAAPAAAAAAPQAASARSGEVVYNKTCVACHASGAAGAPILGNKAAWAPRIQQGLDTLVTHAISGIRAMPPRGTCGDCSDAELRKAVEYMVDKSS